MRILVRLFAAALSIGSLWCQQRTASVEAKSTIGAPISHSMTFLTASCDGSSKIYGRDFDPEKGWRMPLVKVGSKGENVESLPIPNVPDWSVGRAFFVYDNRVLVAGGTRQEFHLAEFGSDGIVQKQTRLAVDSFVDVFHVAKFRSGEYLVVGVTGTIGDRGPHLRTPYTAVFAADGHLVKRISETEDETARERAEGGDPKYLMCCSDSGNEFVGLKADVASASDGNLYLLHGTSPPLIYVISPAGKVVRKLRIEVGNPELTANSIKSYQGRLAIGFNWLGDVPESLIKVIDLQGNPVADLRVKERTEDSDPILACYNSEGFTLIPRQAETKLRLLKVKLP